VATGPQPLVAAEEVAFYFVKKANFSHKEPYMTPYFIAIFLVLVLLAAYFQQTRKPTSLPPFLAKAKPHFFTRSEQTFFNTLTTITNNQAVTILAKVRLSDLVEDLPNAPPSQYNRYAQLHIDFLLIHPTNSAPILAIELDGPSHANPTQANRDLKKNELLKTVNIPLIRFNSQPSPDQLRQSLSPFIK